MSLYLLYLVVVTACLLIYILGISDAGCIAKFFAVPFALIGAVLAPVGWVFIYFALWLVREK